MSLFSNDQERRTVYSGSVGDYGLTGPARNSPHREEWVKKQNASLTELLASQLIYQHKLAGEPHPNYFDNALKEHERFKASLKEQGLSDEEKLKLLTDKCLKLEKELLAKAGKLKLPEDDVPIPVPFAPPGTRIYSKADQMARDSVYAKIEKMLGGGTERDPTDIREQQRRSSEETQSVCANLKTAEWGMVVGGAVVVTVASGGLAGGAVGVALGGAAAIAYGTGLNAGARAMGIHQMGGVNSGDIAGSNAALVNMAIDIRDGTLTWGKAGGYALDLGLEFVPLEKAIPGGGRVLTALAGGKGGGALRKTLAEATISFVGDQAKGAAKDFAMDLAFGKGDKPPPTDDERAQTESKFRAKMQQIAGQYPDYENKMKNHVMSVVNSIRVPEKDANGNNVTDPVTGKTKMRLLTKEEKLPLVSSMMHNLKSATVEGNEARLYQSFDNLQKKIGNTVSEALAKREKEIEAEIARREKLNPSGSEQLVKKNAQGWRKAIREDLAKLNMLRNMNDRAEGKNTQYVTFQEQVTFESAGRQITIPAGSSMVVVNGQVTSFTSASPEANEPLSRMKPEDLKKLLEDHKSALRVSTTPPSYSPPPPPLPDIPPPPPKTVMPETGNPSPEPPGPILKSPASPKPHHETPEPPEHPTGKPPESRQVPAPAKGPSEDHKPSDAKPPAEKPRPQETPKPPEHPPASYKPEPHYQTPEPPATQKPRPPAMPNAPAQPPAHPPEGHKPDPKVAEKPGEHGKPPREGHKGAVHGAPAAPEHGEDHKRKKLLSALTSALGAWKSGTPDNRAAQLLAGLMQALVQIGHKDGEHPGSGHQGPAPAAAPSFRHASRHSDTGRFTNDVSRLTMDASIVNASRGNGQAATAVKALTDMQNILAGANQSGHATASQLAVNNNISNTLEHIKRDPNQVAAFQRRMDVTRLSGGRSVSEVLSDPNASQKDQYKATFVALHVVTGLVHPRQTKALEREADAQYDQQRAIAQNLSRTGQNPELLAVMDRLSGSLQNAGTAQARPGAGRPQGPATGRGAA